jgi:hypothetical protein
VTRTCFHHAAPLWIWRWILCCATRSSESESRAATREGEHLAERYGRSAALSKAFAAANCWSNCKMRRDSRSDISLRWREMSGRPLSVPQSFFHILWFCPGFESWIDGCWYHDNSVFGLPHWICKLCYERNLNFRPLQWRLIICAVQTDGEPVPENSGSRT